MTRRRPRSRTSRRSWGSPRTSSVEKLDTKLYYSYQPVPVAEFVPEEVFFKVREEPERFQGVEVVEKSVRTYPQGPLAAHLVGWVGQINAEEIDAPRFAGYGPSDLVGRAGLEATYERWLRGTPGEERFLVNSDGEVLREFDPKPAEPGHDLRLSLDLDVQRIAEEELAAGIQRARTVYDESSGRNLVANAGAAVVLGSEDRRHRRDGIVADVPPLVVREGALPGAGPATSMRARLLPRSAGPRRSRTRPARRSSRSSRWPP